MFKKQYYKTLKIDSSSLEWLLNTDLDSSQESKKTDYEISRIEILGKRD